ncbi:MAG: hypothetical protein HY719_03375 [Planctomycetes bacterium]|nr:hypothetical protein [Planctomycetota bacterium]
MGYGIVAYQKNRANGGLCAARGLGARPLCLLAAIALLLVAPRASADEFGELFFAAGVPASQSAMLAFGDGSWSPPCGGEMIFSAAVRDDATGAFVFGADGAGADTQARPRRASLFGGRFPIPVFSWWGDGVDLRTVLVPAGPEEVAGGDRRVDDARADFGRSTIAGFWRVVVANTGAAPRSLSVWIVARPAPSQPLPRRLTFERLPGYQRGEALRCDWAGRSRVALLAADEADERGVLDGKFGDVLRVARAGRPLSRLPAAGDGRCSAALRYRVSLQPGERRVLRFAAPDHLDPGERGAHLRAALLLSEDHALAAAGARREWSRLFARTGVRTGDRTRDDRFYANLAGLRAVVAATGSGSLPAAWDRVACDGIPGLLVAGEREVTARALTTLYGPKTRETGVADDNADRLHHLYDVATHLRLYHDLALVRGLWPAVRAAARGLRPNPRRGGDLNNDDRYWNALVAKPLLREVAWMARALGDTAHARWCDAAEKEWNSIRESWEQRPPPQGRPSPEQPGEFARHMGSLRFPPPASRFSGWSGSLLQGCSSLVESRGDRIVIGTVVNSGPIWPGVRVGVKSLPTEHGPVGFDTMVAGELEGLPGQPRAVVSILTLTGSARPPSGYLWRIPRWPDSWARQVDSRLVVRTNRPNGFVRAASALDFPARVEAAPTVTPPPGVDRAAAPAPPLDYLVLRPDVTFAVALVSRRE